MGLRCRGTVCGIPGAQSDRFRAAVIPHKACSAVKSQRWCRHVWPLFVHVVLVPCVLNRCRSDMQCPVTSGDGAVEGWNAADGPLAAGPSSFQGSHLADRRAATACNKLAGTPRVVPAGEATGVLTAREVMGDGRRRQDRFSATASAIDEAAGLT